MCSRKPRIANPEKIQKIVDNYLTAFNTEKAKLDSETGYGSDWFAIIKWEAKIMAELDNLNRKTPNKK
jgi:hypothetical protein